MNLYYVDPCLLTTLPQPPIMLLITNNVPDSTSDAGVNASMNMGLEISSCRQEHLCDAKLFLIPLYLNQPTQILKE